MNDLVIDEFGRGVDLRKRPGELEIGSAVDLRDVWFPEPGAVAARPGFTHLSADLGVDIVALGLHLQSNGTRHLVVGVAGGELRIYDTAGALFGSALLTPTADTWSMVRYGTPALESTFMANGTDALFRWDGTTLNQPALTGSAGVGTGRFLCVQPREQRLVNARFVGTAADRNPSAARFSDPANPLSFGTTNFVQMTPGDGEAITGAAAWREFTFLFKPSRIQVFYGNSVNAQGNPEFNFDMVEAGVGCSFPGAVCTGRDGVYFIHRTGIYRISGIQDPVRISDPIDPLFTGDLSYYYEQTDGEAINLASGAANAFRLSWHDEKLYVTVPTGVATRPTMTLMYDSRIGAWTLWRLPVIEFVGLDNELYFVLADARQRIVKTNFTEEDDGGVPIVGWWQGAYIELSGDAGTRVLRQTMVTGGGKFNVEVGVDYQLAGDPKLVDFTGGLETWGGGGGPDEWESGENPDDIWGPQVELASETVRNDTLRGLRHSVKFSSVDGTPWQVHRATHYFEQPSQRPVEKS